ncbi:hypothetical protein ACHAXR_000148, partial [Thalassiosira sp. AJA248-18]
LGCRYRRGGGVPQDSNKALELWNRAARLGCAKSHCAIAYAYYSGDEGVEKDMTKAKYHWELGAMGRDVLSRHNLGLLECLTGNMNRAMKHFMISAAFGNDDSMEKIQSIFSEGYVTKDDFEKALRAHKEFKDEMQCDHRDEFRRNMPSEL